MSAKPASKGLGERLVEAVERGILSIAGISLAGVSFFKKTLKSHRDEESPVRRRRNDAALPLDEEQLEELQRLIADECKVRVSRKSIRHALKKLNPPLVKGD
jgi:hypothetical protein